MCSPPLGPRSGPCLQYNVLTAQSVPVRAHVHLPGAGDTRPEQRCPRRDSNPQPRRFKRLVSAGWTTGAAARAYVPGAPRRPVLYVGRDVSHTAAVSAPAPARVSVREVLGHREFQGVLLSAGLSVLGDQVTRIAVALLVYDRTGSAFASSATYACSYLSWLVGGPVLSALADRHRRRRLMVVCDLLRLVLVGLLVVPGVPLGVVFLVLVLVGLLAPPFDAAKGALLPELLEGDRYVTGSAVLNVVTQGAQIGGFLVGGLLVAAVGARGALAVDALTFLASAVAVAALVRERPAPDGAGTSIAGDVRQGVRVVAGSPTLLRMLAFGALGAVVVVAPEGLAVPVAYRLGGGAVLAGLLSAAVPAGFLVGSFLVLRVDPDRRAELLPALLALACVPLLLTPFTRSGAAVAALWLLSGAGGAGQLVANAGFMTAAPAHARGRAFGLAVTVLMAVQGLVLLTAGALSEAVDPRWAVAAAALLALALLPLVPRAAPRPVRPGGAPA